MSTYGEMTAAAATEAAGLRAVALALLVTVAFSCAFFYMMRWAASASSSERSRRKSSRHQRGNGGDGFMSVTKHKKSTSAVRQRKKNINAKNTGTSNVGSATTLATSPVNINGDKKTKKAIGDTEVYATAETVPTTIATNKRSHNVTVNKTNQVVISGAKDVVKEEEEGVAAVPDISGDQRNHRNRRQKQQEQAKSRSGGNSSTNSHDNFLLGATTTVINGGHRRRSSSWSSHSHADDNILGQVVDGRWYVMTNGMLSPVEDDDQDQGEWITMVTNTIIYNIIH